VTLVTWRSQQANRTGPSAHIGPRLALDAGCFTTNSDLISNPHAASPSAITGPQHNLCGLEGSVCGPKTVSKAPAPGLEPALPASTWTLTGPLSCDACTRPTGPPSTDLHTVLDWPMCPLRYAYAMHMPRDMGMPRCAKKALPQERAMHACVPAAVSNHAMPLPQGCCGLLD
jgi:hypothetical protein